MATITLRSTKGSALTNAEVDANFTNLNTGKLETSEVVATATANKVLRLDASGALPASITGNAANVTGTVAIANGGTGATTRQAAMDALAGATTSGQYLRGNGTDVVMSAIQAADVPTLNQNTTGTASNVTGTVAIANGGTGATTAAAAVTNLGGTTVGSNFFKLTNPSAITFPRINADNTVTALARQDAMDALAGATTSGYYLRGNGTDVVMSAIQAADVPTLNQNTTGNAATATTATNQSGGTVSATSISDSGNLTFTGTSNRITGDFSNATRSNRLLFQTSTTNGTSNIGAIPNGTQAQSGLQLYNNSDPDNSSYTALTCTAFDCRITAGANGTGTYFPLVFFTNNAEKMRIDTQGNVLVGTSSSATPSTSGYISSANTFGFKNRIINGDMRIDQRNGGVSQTIATGSNIYTVDRWFAVATGANVTGQRVTGAVANTYRYQFTGAASNTAIQFAQRIEANNCADLAGQSVTISFDMANSLLSSVSYRLRYASATDYWGGSNTTIIDSSVAVTSTVTRYSFTVSIPAGATTGLQLIFYTGAQTSGTWTIGNVQLEKGSAATSFDYRPYGTELALCQRYFWKSEGQFLNGALLFDLYNVAGAQVISSSVCASLPPMRTIPTVTVPSGTYSNISSGAFGSVAGSGVVVNYGGLTATGRAYYQTNTTGYITAASEL